MGQRKNNYYAIQTIVGLGRGKVLCSNFECYNLTSEFEIILK